LWFIAEHLIRNGGVLDGFDVEGSRLVCSNDATGAARAALFDLLISAKQYRWGYGKTERLGGLEVHDHLEFVGNCTGSFAPTSRSNNFRLCRFSICVTSNAGAQLRAAVWTLLILMSMVLRVLGQLN